MKRKRFIKLCMSYGKQRNEAAVLADIFKGDARRSCINILLAAAGIHQVHDAARCMMDAVVRWWKEYGYPICHELLPLTTKETEEDIEK